MLKRLLSSLSKIWLFIYIRFIYGFARRHWLSYNGPMPLRYRKSYILVIFHSNNGKINKREIVVYKSKYYWRRILRSLVLDRKKYNSIVRLVADCYPADSEFAVFAFYEPKSFKYIISGFLRGRS